MLKWYKNLYIGENAKKKAKSIIRKINWGTSQLGVYVISLATNEADHLEIFSSNYLLQKEARKICPMIVGIAKGYDEAICLVQAITEEVYMKTQTTNIRTFLEEEARKA